jgi:8-oxo-dGTP pyrophosphatase MutT (NUDIX family)
VPEVTPWPGYDVERTSVRVVLIDDDGRILLFHTIDPTMPELGHWWELPGGGVEPGESYAETASREIEEETSFVLGPVEFGPARWRRDSTYARRHTRVWQHEVVVTAHVPGVAPRPGAAGRTPEELVDYLDHRWWSLAEIEAAAASTRFFPTLLPSLLRGFLDGESIDEPFDRWN